MTCHIKIWNNTAKRKLKKKEKRKEIKQKRKKFNEGIQHLVRASKTTKILPEKRQGEKRESGIGPTCMTPEGTKFPLDPHHFRDIPKISTPKWPQVKPGQKRTVFGPYCHKTTNQVWSEWEISIPLDKVFQSLYFRSLGISFGFLHFWELRCFGHKN